MTDAPKKSTLSESDDIGKPSDWFPHIAIVRSDVKREYFPTEDAYLSEQECIARAEVVKKEVENLGIVCDIVVADDFLSERLAALKPNLCINFTDSVRGHMPSCAGIPTTFDLLGIPYVGANTLCLSLNCNKYLTKTLLEAWELPTPQYQLFHKPTQEIDYELRYPLILKLNEEHGSVGISEKSVVTNEKELRAQLEYLISTYRQHVLAEEFIEDGRELTALALESDNLRVFISERVYEPITKRFKLVTFEFNYSEHFGLNPQWEHRQFIDHGGHLRSDIRKAFEILKMDDIARFDVMLDKYGNHYIIDCNSNPSFGPEEAVASIAKVNGKTFQDVLVTILRRNMMDRTSVAGNP
jgi:D-alanine-D-alanine ligase